MSSFEVPVEDQDDMLRYWEALLAIEGGKQAIESYCRKYHLPIVENGMDDTVSRIARYALKDVTQVDLS